LPGPSSLLLNCVAAGLLAVLSITPCASQASLLNRPAPEFARTDLKQRRIDLRHYRGKLVLLNFWATWCVPCAQEMPRFVEWQNQYGPRGLQILGISMDDDPALARAACRRLNLNYPVVMGDAKLGELYGGVLGLPVTFLIDAHGEVRARFDGEANLDQMETQLERLLPRR
jgi:peroxiredoxin